MGRRGLWGLRQGLQLPGRGAAAHLPHASSSPSSHLSPGTGDREEGPWGLRGGAPPSAQAVTPGPRTASSSGPRGEPASPSTCGSASLWVSQLNTENLKKIAQKGATCRIPTATREHPSPGGPQADGGSRTGALRPEQPGEGTLPSEAPSSQGPTGTTAPCAPRKPGCGKKRWGRRSQLGRARSFQLAWPPGHPKGSRCDLAKPRDLRFPTALPAAPPGAPDHGRPPAARLLSPTVGGT